MDDLTFQKTAEAALELLKRKLYDAEEDGGFEVEERGGALHVVFDDPPGTFVVSPNSAVRQIWISALATSFKLDWSDAEKDFVLPKTGEDLSELMSRLIGQQTGSEVRL